MRKTVLGAGLVSFLLFNIFCAETKAEAPTQTNAVSQSQEEVLQTVDFVQPEQALQTKLHRLAAMPEFQDWQQGKATPVRYLYDPDGLKTAILWQVQSDGQQNLGYLVSTLDGQGVYEFSRRAVPKLPVTLLPKRKNQGYIYAGPMLHLVYLQDGDRVELYNLLTGETLPAGELRNKVPRLRNSSMLDATQQTPVQNRSRVQPVPQSQAPDTDALYATGVYGLHKSEPQPNVQPLIHYAEGRAFEKPAFVVYDPIPDQFLVSLTVTGLLQVDDTYYVGVQSPFAEATGAPVYMDSRFPVSVVETSTPSVTNNNAK